MARLPSLWFLLACCVHHCQPTTTDVDVSSFRHHSYSTVSNPTSGLTHTMDTSPSLSLMQCGAWCTWDVRCRSFLWNSDTGQCRISNGWPSDAGNLKALGAENLFYQRVVFLTQVGFELRSHAGLTRWVYISPLATSHDNAREFCEGVDSRLFKANSVDLIDLVNEYAAAKGYPTTESIHIGLDDKAQGNVFVWSDGQVMTVAERDLLFTDPIPDNAENEDCVLIANHLPATYLDDVQCDELSIFACEVDYH